jgi:hypothetical protein
MNTMNWERLWRSAGLQFAFFFIVAYVIYGSQRKVGASADQLVAFYDGNRTRILIATVVFAYAALNLLWFAAALTSALRDAGQGGWGAAVTACLQHSARDCPLAAGCGGRDPRTRSSAPETACSRPE